MICSVCHYPEVLWDESFQYTRCHNCGAVDAQMTEEEEQDFEEEDVQP